MNKFYSGVPLALFVASSVCLAGPVSLVTNGNNDGPGSLRAALASNASHIIIDASVDTISISDTLVYSGTAALKLSGSDQIIDASSLHSDILQIVNGTDLNISNLTFTGPGGYNFDNQGGGKGIFVDVPVSKTGTINLMLTNVSVTGTGNHGIHVSDCTLADDCGGGGGGAGDGSVASINVQFTNVTVDGAGFGKADADGVRIDERNEGDITFSATNSTFINVGADGVELDEGNNGNVFLNVRNSTFNDNGAYCLGNIDLKEGDPCYDDGDPDVDDGFDIDEAGPGSIKGKIENLTVVNNLDEGLDFDEEDAGGFDLDLVAIYAIGNEDEGIKISEENDGSSIVSMRAIDLQNNNGSKEDIEIEEADSGDVAVKVNGSFVDEIKVEEDGSGKGTIKVRGSTILEPLDLDNVENI